MTDRGHGRAGFRGDRGSFRGDRGGFRGGRGGFDRGRGDYRGGRGGGRGGRGGFGPVRVYRDENFPPPNPEVKKLEDASVNSVNDLASSLNRLDLQRQFPQRPGYGTAGTEITLWANYFDLQAIEGTVLHRYAVSFAATGEKELAKAKKTRLIQLLLLKPPFQNVIVASDWAQLMITSKALDLGGGKKEFDVEWFPPDGEPLPMQADNEPDERKQKRRRNTFKLRVEKIGDVSLSEVMKDLSFSATYPLKTEAIQALNIILALGPSTDPQTTVVKQNRFYPFGNHPQTAFLDLGGGLQALRGYYSSVRTSIGRILVNVNVTTTTFHKPGPLLRLIKDFFGTPKTVKEWDFMANFFNWVQFETNYVPATDANGRVKKGKNGQPLTKRKMHRIIDIPYKRSSQTERFDWTDNGRTTNVTVEEYFRLKYNMRLTCPQAPVVNFGTMEQPMYIPVELCTVLPGQIARRFLSAEQTSHMITFAARPPYQNAESIVHDGSQVMKIHPSLSGNLGKFGIKINPELLTVTGRVLPPPSLSYRSTVFNPENGAWNLDPRRLGQKPFKIARPLPSWNCLVLNIGDPEVRPDVAPTVIENLRLFRKTLDTYGMNPGPVQQPVAGNIDPSWVVEKMIPEIKEQITATLKTLKAWPNFLHVLLPSDSAVVYDCVKYVCDIELGIPCICSIGTEFSRGSMQYFANECLKYNQKLGGVNHTVPIKQLSPLDAETIVFGIDVTHPSPGSGETAPSIAGVVASVDANFSQYPASIRTQKGREEMVEDLAEMVFERFDLWRKRNGGRLPTKVIIYRDGVSESQYSIVMEKEYPAFVKAFKKLYPAKAKHPKLSLIIVTKRHHTRFYPTKLAECNPRNGNPLPGTVVDRGITGERLFDFYLIAHQGLQGTSKPAHYVVLKDDNGLGADQLYTLTYNLCYTFARATRSVSVCPPAYYADLLCERGRAYLHGVMKADTVAFDRAGDALRGVHPQLAETMFYI